MGEIIFCIALKDFANSIDPGDGAVNADMFKRDLAAFAWVWSSS